MMGAPVGRQDRLFYEFDLEDMVPSDHLRRRIDAVLDPSWARDELKPYYNRGQGRVPADRHGSELEKTCETRHQTTAEPHDRLIPCTKAQPDSPKK